MVEGETGWIYIALLLLGGLLILIIGGERFLRGASRLAENLGLSPLWVGIVIALFTAAPEAALVFSPSIMEFIGASGLAPAATGGSAASSEIVQIGPNRFIEVVSESTAFISKFGADLPVAIVVGSSIVNTLLITTLTVFLWAVAFRSRSEMETQGGSVEITLDTVFRDGIILLGASWLLIWFVSRGGTIGVEDGVLLLGGLLFYFVNSFATERSLVAAGAQPSFRTVSVDGPISTGGIIYNLLIGSFALIIGSLLVMVALASWIRTLEDGANPRESLNAITLTLIVFFTAMPEIVTIFLAALRRQPEIASGNFIASSIVNIFGVLGLAAILQPTGEAIAIGSFFHFDLTVLTGGIVLLVFFLFTQLRLTLLEAMTLFFLYVAYATIRYSGNAPEVNFGGGV